ncbi:hypothetical protein [Streptomyces sp. 11x1]|uniref:hypothetical protein n=1 Tax=Streptomyces sp. 11x1 TaxID=3038642 RepID=UPI0029300E5F|nr:hypothetical protein [Streptomyces sp. 11x1]WNZ06378.1 hypothetical protein P8T65_01365 [Streptomyces sp. 11x1]
MSVVLGIVVSWLWYQHWHDGNVNSERSDKAFALIRKQARATADDTARALDTSGTTDADALIGVIWQHSEAPVITYDTSRREFTATAAKSAQYDDEAILPGGGPVKVTRCFVFTFAQRPGQAWTARASERDDDVCRPSTQIGNRVRLAMTRISSMYAEDLTRAGVQDALDPTARRSFDVKNVVRQGDTMTVSVLVSSSQSAVKQCYRFTRPVPGDDGHGSATAVPTSSC